MLEEQCGRDLRDLAYDLVVLGFLLFSFGRGFELVLLAVVESLILWFGGGQRV